MDLMSMQPAGGVALPGMPAEPVGSDVPGGEAPEEGDSRPPESDEQRGGMPKPAVLFKQTQRTRTAARQHHHEREKPDDVPLSEWDPIGRFAAPKVVGVRRHIEVDPETFFDEEEAAHA